MDINLAYFSEQICRYIHIYMCMYVFVFFKKMVEVLDCDFRKEENKKSCQISYKYIKHQFYYNDLKIMLCIVNFFIFI